jgi:hypothetical protein
MTAIVVAMAGNRLKVPPHVPPIWGDPAEWAQVGVNRVTGQRFYGIVKVVDVTKSLEIGMWDVLRDANNCNAVRITNDTLVIMDSGVATPVLYVPADNAEYPICMICGSGGGIHLFIYIASNWQYFGHWGTNSKYPLYLGVANYDATFDADAYNTPYALVLPAPLSSDGFGSAFGTTDGLGHAEGVSGEVGLGGSGKTWSPTATWSIVAGKAVNTPTEGGTLVTNGNMASAEPPGTAWTRGTGWTITGGVAVKVAGAVALLGQAVLTAGSWYKITWDLVTRTAGTFQSYIGGKLGTGRSVPASYLATGRANSASVGVSSVGSSAAGTVDNIVVTLLTFTSLLSAITETTSDIVVSVDIIKQDNTQAGLILCLDNRTTPLNYILVYLDGTGNLLVDKCVGGTISNVITGVVTYVASATMRVDKSGSAIRVYYNNLFVGSGVVADAGVISNLLHGMFSTTSGNSLDNYDLEAKGTSGEHVALSTE